eukprot:EG_transcript_7175
MDGRFPPPQYGPGPSPPSRPYPGPAGNDYNVAYGDYKSYLNESRRYQPLSAYPKGYANSPAYSSPAAAYDDEYVDYHPATRGLYSERRQYSASYAPTYTRDYYGAQPTRSYVRPLGATSASYSAPTYTRGYYGAGGGSSYAAPTNTRGYYGTGGGSSYAAPTYTRDYYGADVGTRSSYVRPLGGAAHYNAPTYSRDYVRSVEGYREAAYEGYGASYLAPTYTQGYSGGSYIPAGVTSAFGAPTYTREGCQACEPCDPCGVTVAAGTYGYQPGFVAGPVGSAVPVTATGVASYGPGLVTGTGPSPSVALGAFGYEGYLPGAVFPGAVPGDFALGLAPTTFGPFGAATPAITTPVPLGGLPWTGASPFTTNTFPLGSVGAPLLAGTTVVADGTPALPLGGVAGWPAFGAPAGGLFGDTALTAGFPFGTGLPVAGAGLPLGYDFSQGTGWPLTGATLPTTWPTTWPATTALPAFGGEGVGFLGTPFAAPALPVVSGATSVALSTTSTLPTSGAAANAPAP